jgi:hypothetical protein
VDKQPSKMAAYDEYPHDHFLDDFGGAEDDDAGCGCAYFATDKCASCREQEEMWAEEMARLQAEEEAAAALLESPPPPSAAPLRIRTPSPPRRDWSYEVGVLRDLLDRNALAKSSKRRADTARDVLEAVLEFEDFFAQHPKMRDAVHEKIAEMRPDPLAQRRSYQRLLTEVEEFLDDLAQRPDYVP